MKRKLRIAMLALAAQAHQRTHPHATEDEAWAAAQRTAHLYREQAIDFLTMLAIDQQTAAEARERRN
jgi:hypothetical protein